MKGARGLALGVLALLALQVLTDSRGPEAGAAGLGWLVSGFRRLIDPAVAGIPNPHGYVDPITAYNVDPKTGVPNQDPHKPYLRDPQGRIL